jgi:hypothetical protein
MRRLGSLLTAVALLIFLIGLAPHLVHHVFDEHDELAPAETCVLASAADRQQPDTPGILASPDHADPVDRLHTAELPPRPGRRAAGAVGTRAPPAASV